MTELPLVLKRLLVSLLLYTRSSRGAVALLLHICRLLLSVLVVVTVLAVVVPFDWVCLLYTSPSPRDGLLSRMPSSA